MTRVIAFALFGFAVGAQDAPKAGSVSGKVTDAQSGEPVARAVVILHGDQSGPVGARSDAEGKFALSDIAPGRYTVDVQRKRYVAARDSQRNVTVTAGSAATDVGIKLTRTGAISGRVTDADGEPVTGASVQIMLAHAKAQPGSVSSAITDDRGQYRAYFVAPGEYRAIVMYSGDPAMTVVRMQGETGQAYPNTYYPGVVDESQAGIVRIAPGADLAGVDIRLMRSRGVRVRGRVQGSAEAVGPSVTFVAMIAAGGRGRSAPNRSYERVIDGAKGDFEFNDVLPGRYRVTAQTTSFGEPQQQRLSAQQTVDVGGADLEGIDLALGPVRKVPGRFVVPEGRTLPKGLMVLFASRDGGGGGPESGGIGMVAADGSFTVGDVGPGEYDVFVATAPGTEQEDDLYISAIRSGSEDVLAEGLRVGAGPVASIDIVVKPNGASLDATATDEKENPITGATVWLVPDPPRDRQFALAGTCKTRAGGKCTISGITPGSYHAYAVPEGLELDARDPEAWKSHEKYAQPVRVGEGDKKSLALKVVAVD